MCWPDTIMLSMNYIYWSLLTCVVPTDDRGSGAARGGHCHGIIDAVSYQRTIRGGAGHGCGGASACERLSNVELIKVKTQQNNIFLHRTNGVDDLKKEWLIFTFIYHLKPSLSEVSSVDKYVLFSDEDPPFDNPKMQQTPNPPAQDDVGAPFFCEHSWQDKLLFSIFSSCNIRSLLWCNKFHWDLQHQHKHCLRMW